jgi:hypothetical protein
MKAVHVTKTQNLNSIFKSGIFRNKPLLEQFEETMQKDYGSKYDAERGLVFSFAYDDTEERFFNHFVYWDMWGKPRNELLTVVDDKTYWDMNEVGPKAFSHIQPIEESYTAILIEIPDHPLYGWYQHQQSHDMNPVWIDMEERYEHNDKSLVLINYDIHPSCIKGVLGTANGMVNKEKKIDVFMNMKKKGYGT